MDTPHFKGTAPGACSLDACVLRQDVDETALVRSDWRELLPYTALEPDARQAFEDGLKPMQGVTHVRLNIYPDGGVARLRVYGRRETGAIKGAVR